MKLNKIWNRYGVPLVEGIGYTLAAGAMIAAPIAAGIIIETILK